MTGHTPLQPHLHIQHIQHINRHSKSTATKFSHFVNIFVKLQQQVVKCKHWRMYNIWKLIPMVKAQPHSHTKAQPHSHAKAQSHSHAKAQPHSHAKYGLIPLLCTRSLEGGGEGDDCVHMRVVEIWQSEECLGYHPSLCGWEEKGGGRGEEWGVREAVAEERVPGTSYLPWSVQ